VLNATMDGSLSTMPRPRAKMQVLAVPRSMATSVAKAENRFIVLSHAEAKAPRATSKMNETAGRVSEAPPCPRQEERCRCWHPLRHEAFRRFLDYRLTQSLEKSGRADVLRSHCDPAAVTNLSTDHNSGIARPGKSVTRETGVTHSRQSSPVTKAITGGRRRGGRGGTSPGCRSREPLLQRFQNSTSREDPPCPPLLLPPVKVFRDK
jgi:hypothetical protein